MAGREQRLSNISTFEKKAVKLRNYKKRPRKLKPAGQAAQMFRVFFAQGPGARRESSDRRTPKPKARLATKPNALTHRATMTMVKTLATKM